MDKLEYSYLIEQKTLWEKQKLLVMSNFSFSHNVFKSRLLLMCQNEYLWSEGLKGGNQIMSYLCYMMPKYTTVHIIDLVRSYCNGRVTCPCPFGGDHLLTGLLSEVFHANASLTHVKKSIPPVCNLALYSPFMTRTHYQMTKF